MAQDGQATNESYGGLNLIRSKMNFPNSSVDPQHILGIIKNISEDLPAMLIEDNTVVTNYSTIHKPDRKHQDVLINYIPYCY